MRWGRWDRTGNDMMMLLFGSEEREKEKRGSGLLIQFPVSFVKVVFS
jgi:hypothetical protein